MVSVWAEYLISETATPLAFYDHPEFGKYPALTRNNFGKGSLTYEGTFLSDGLQDKVVLDTLRAAAVLLPDKGLPSPVKAEHARLADGAALHAFFNYSGRPQKFNYGYLTGNDMLTGTVVMKGREVTLPPWDLVLIKESREK